MTTEKFQFSNLAELRDWLNRFKSTDLETVFPYRGDYYELVWSEKTLTDGSTVNDADISTIA